MPLIMLQIQFLDNPVCNASHFWVFPNFFKRMPINTPIGGLLSMLVVLGIKSTSLKFIKGIGIIHEVWYYFIM